MELIVTTKADLQALLKEQAEVLITEFKEILESIKTEKSAKTEKEYASIKEVCQYLGITRSTLMHWTKKGRLKQYSIEGRVFYKLPEIKDAMLTTNNKTA